MKGIKGQPALLRAFFYFEDDNHKDILKALAEVGIETIADLSAAVWRWQHDPANYAHNPNIENRREIIRGGSLGFSTLQLYLTRLMKQKDHRDWMDSMLKAFVQYIKGLSAPRSREQLYAALRKSTPAGQAQTAARPRPVQTDSEWWRDYMDYRETDLNHALFHAFGERWSRYAGEPEVGALKPVVRQWVLAKAG